MILFNQIGGAKMAIEVFNRYEHKYMLDRETFEKVIKILDNFIKSLLHGIILFNLFIRKSFKMSHSICED